MCAPVTYEASAESRNATTVAISWLVPVGRSGIPVAATAAVLSGSAAVYPSS
jgi:hypothetical protein